jgi:hypothetical protein
VNSPEEGPVGPKHVEIRRYENKIEIVTSVGFSFHILKGCTVKKLKSLLVGFGFKFRSWSNLSPFFTVASNWPVLLTCSFRTISNNGVTVNSEGQS